jgi:hypothetical protein
VQSAGKRLPCRHSGRSLAHLAWAPIMAFMPLLRLVRLLLL